MIFRQANRGRQNSAFTLVELLTVMVIIVILAAMVVSSPMLWRSTNVTTAGNLVMDDMAYARELAVSSNEPAEIWFLQPTGSTPIVALQTYTVDLNGAETAYGPIHHLPQNIIIDSGTALSSLFLSTPNNFKKSGTLPSITGYGTSYAAWCVRFMPDGSISSPTGPATQNLFLTLHDIALGDQLTASPLPKNYALINTDYVTGAVTLYRP